MKKSAWMAHVLNFVIAFGGAYCMVFVGSLLTIWLWTDMPLSQNMIVEIAKKCFLFSGAIGFILFVSLESRRRRLSSVLRDALKGK